MTRMLRAVAAIACGAGMWACSSSTDNSKTTTTNGGGSVVTATTANTFTPNPLSVTVGTTVTFVFEAVTHNVTFAGATGAPSNISDAVNTSVTRTFSTVGTFSFVCTLHPGMSGAVIVTAAAPGY